MNSIDKLKTEFESFKEYLRLKGLTEDTIFNYIKGYKLEMCYKCKTLNAYRTIKNKSYSYYKCMKCGFRWCDENDEL